MAEVQDPSWPASAPGRRGGIHRFRRWFQVAFLLLFFGLLTLTAWPLGSLFLGVFLGADPLIALNTALDGVWLWPMGLALAMLALPLVAGRAFCGYVCPTGTILETTTPSCGRGSLNDSWKDRLRRAPSYVLLGCLGLLLFTNGSYLFFDPLATLTRTATVLLYPLLDRVLRLAGDTAWLLPPLRGGVDLVTALISGHLVFPRPLAYAMQVGVLCMFTAMLALSWLEPRMWCRHLCPLGALLGLVARLAPMGRRVDRDLCKACGLCAKACPMDAISTDFLATDASRCQACYACSDACQKGAIRFGGFGSKVAFSPSRRQALAAGGFAALVGFFGFTGVGRRVRNPWLLRPPGARHEPDLLALCCRCGQCMKVCPTNVLQPSVSEAGLEGVFTPRMDFRLASCDWSCHECGKVCPTGAIQRLTLEAKRQAVIGRAYIDRSRCIPWVDGKSCLVCQELCPVPEKAIAIHQAPTMTPEGRQVVLGHPEVIASRCIGCGICQNACPVPNQPAILVYAPRDGHAS